VSRNGDLADYRDIFADMNPMPEAALKEAWGPHRDTGGNVQKLTVGVTNTSGKIAYFVRLCLDGESPRYRASYSDNYFSLLPGETKSIDVSVETVGHEPPRGGVTLTVTGWNCPRNAVTITQ